MAIGKLADLDSELLDILACPSPDHARLSAGEREGAPVLICSVCQTAYPVRDGIPVLLVDDAFPGPNGIGVAVESV